MKSRIPAELPHENVVAIIDTREQLPLDLSPLQTELGRLAAGDYSVKGLEKLVAIERKSLSDFLCCVGSERERFEACVQRLLGYEVRAIVVESTWGILEAGEWRSKVTAAAAVGSAMGWIAAGVPVVMCSDHARAGRFVSRLLYIAARREYRKCRSLLNHVREVCK